MSQIFVTPRLFTPGPTPVPYATKASILHHDLYHRGKEFAQILEETRQWLAPIFGTPEPPLILTSSGTGAMEASITNFTDIGEEVLVVKGGKFGERWLKLAEAFGLTARVLDIPWGHKPKSEEILAVLVKFPAIKHIFIQAHESSTGTYYDLENLLPKIRQTFQGFIFIDAISSLLAHPMKMEEWQIDVVVAGSQKGFSIPPGLSFIAASPRAWNFTTERSAFYFDLKRERREQRQGQTAWTPATSLVEQLHFNLALLVQQGGVERILAHHAHVAQSVRHASQNLNLALFSQAPSNSLTALALPEHLPASRITGYLRQNFSMNFAAGQDHFKEKILRFAHLGFVDIFSIISGFSALEMALKAEGHEFEFGEGTKQLMCSLTSSMS